MTWLGKILTFLVMITAVAGAYFTAQAYVTRTNWKFEADKYKTAYRDAVTKRDEEYRRNQSSEDALKRLLAIERNKSESLGKEVVSLSEAAKKSTNDLKLMQDEYDKGDVKATLQAANIQTTLNELDSTRGRTNVLEDRQLRLVIEREEALREKVRAENAQRLAQSIADDNIRKAEELGDKLRELRATGGNPSAGVIRALDRPPPPVLANLRGQVNRILGDQVELTIGIDAGLSKGSVLDVMRLDGGGRYLGTIRIDQLWPKQAVGTFIPARPGVQFERLRPEELPRKGDEVRPPDGR